MRDKVEGLERMEDDVVLSVDAAKRNLDVVGREGEAWMKKVVDVKVGAHDILKGTDKVKNGCLNGWCPNLKQRYFLSQRAVNLTDDVAQLQQEGNKYTKLAYPAPPLSSTLTWIAEPSEVFPTRNSKTKEILAALKDDQISMIGICGLGGVGKTTMVNEVCARVKVENLFNEIAKATVSQNQDLTKIQNQLADNLGLTNFKENDSTVARKELLRQRLSINGKRTLVILDDLWEELDLGELGLPVVGGGECKGCKVLLTSRMEQVCIRMSTQKNFTVEGLSREEAWDLFKEKAGDCVEATGLGSIAKEVADECGGLPLAIVTVGKALKNKYQKHAWEDALQQLKTSTVTSIAGMRKNVYASLALSYNHLENDEIKSLLLLCCLFPEDTDIWIEHLFRYVAGLRLFKHVQNLAETRNRVNTLVDELRSCYLLLEGGKEGTVKMHDVVRDFGLTVASNGEHVYMVRHDARMKEWPQNDMKEACTALSLRCGRNLELPTGLDCSRLELLQIVMFRSTIQKLFFKMPSTQNLLRFFTGRITVSSAPPKILSYFYGKMKEVRVIHFGQMVFSFYPGLHELPPKAPQSLMALQTLCLESCRFCPDMTLIGSLQNLEILSFYYSDIDALPSEIGQLSKLKLLDLRCRLNFIPSGVLSNLNKLEELYMGWYFYASNDQKDSALITELHSLSHLNTLQIYISDDGLLELKDIRFNKLQRFDVSVNFKGNKFGGYQMPNRVKLQRIDVSVFLRTWINDSMRICEELTLQEVEGLKNIVKKLDTQGFRNLKILFIEDCKDLIQICPGILPEGSFGRLQEVRLSLLHAMEHFLRGPIQPPCLSNLRVLSMMRCNAITSLFPLSAVECLVQLERLHLSFCPLLAEIVSKGAEDAKTIVFPKLYHLELGYLPSLRSVVTVSDIHVFENNHEEAKQHRVILPSIEKLELRGFNKVVHIVGGLIPVGSYKPKMLKIDDCEKVLHFATSDAINLLQNLEELDVEGCASLEMMFDLEGLNVLEEHSEMVLGQLQKMKLTSLPKLTRIWKTGSKGIQGFQNLTSLVVKRCDSLMYLVSPCMAKFLVNLERITIQRCKMMEEVIQTEGEDSCFFQIEKMDKVVFPHLRHITLSRLENLAMFCGGNHDIELQSLDYVLIDQCPKIKYFCSGPLIAPKLESADLGNGKCVWMGDLNNTIRHLDRSAWL